MHRMGRIFVYFTPILAFPLRGKGFFAALPGPAGFPLPVFTGTCFAGTTMEEDPRMTGICGWFDRLTTNGCGYGLRLCRGMVSLGVWVVDAAVWRPFLRLRFRLGARNGYLGVGSGSLGP